MSGGTEPVAEGIVATWANRPAGFCAYLDKSLPAASRASLSMEALIALAADESSSFSTTVNFARTLSAKTANRLHSNHLLFQHF